MRASLCVVGRRYSESLCVQWEFVLAGADSLPTYAFKIVYMYGISQELIKMWEL